MQHHQGRSKEGNLQQKQWNATDCKFTFIVQENPLPGSYTSMHRLFEMPQLNASKALTVLLVQECRLKASWQSSVGYSTLTSPGPEGQRFSCFVQCMPFKCALSHGANHAPGRQIVNNESPKKIKRRKEGGRG